MVLSGGFDDYQDNATVPDGGSSTWDSLWNSAQNAVVGEAQRLIGTLLKKGSKSNDVYTLQQLLCVNGFPITADGQFGPATERALKEFQSSKGLSPSGTTDAVTWEKLNNGWDRNKYPNLNNSVCVTPGNNSNNTNNNSNSTAITPTGNSSIIVKTESDGWPWWAWTLIGLFGLSIIGAIIYFFYKK